MTVFALLAPEQKHPTTNIQHRTFIGCHSRKHWMFDVGCWLLDVPQVHGK
jgi:hypothetical protein